MHKKRMLLGIALVAVLALGVAAAGCGDDENDTDAAVETDGDFIAAMVPHHASAIEMAEIAQRRAEHEEIEELAAEIVETQSAEIDQLKVDHERVFDEPLEAMGGEHGMLGLSEHEAGMAMDESELEQAKPFDLSFIDAMIPHHQGAIRMARIELAQGDDPELRSLAEAIIEAQAHEIDEMNSWRERWYGNPSPAGGVPSEDEAMPSHGTMGH